MPALQPCVLVALAVVAAAAHSAAAAQGTMRRTLTAPVHADECPASVDLEAPAQQELSLCRQFSDDSCCSVREDRNITDDYEPVLRTIFNDGCPGCSINMRHALCAFKCHPQQADFMSLPSESRRGLFRVCRSFCERWHDSCRSLPRFQHYSSPHSFCKAAFSVVDGYELHVTDEDDCFMEYGPNHCDGRATGLPIPVKSPITIWWILLCVLVMGFAVAVMVFVVKRTMERKAVYQPVPAEPTPGDPSVRFEYRVQDAGLAFVNGPYSRVGEKNGLPYFCNHAGVTLSREVHDRTQQSGWIIGKDGKALYGCMTDEPLPPMQGWRVYSVAPAPLVIALEEDAVVDGEEGSVVEPTDAGNGEAAAEVQAE